jgi:hypothetical protein
MKAAEVTEMMVMIGMNIPEVIQVPEVPEVDIRNDRSEAA